MANSLDSGTPYGAKVHADLRDISAAIRAFKLDNARYPETLRELIGPPPPHDAYLLQGEKALRDPWKRPYLYDPSKLDGPPTVRTLGADGRPGGKGSSADISVDLNPDD